MPLTTGTYMTFLFVTTTVTGLILAIDTLGHRAERNRRLITQRRAEATRTDWNQMPGQGVPGLQASDQGVPIELSVLGRERAVADTFVDQNAREDGGVEALEAQRPREGGLGARGRGGGNGGVEIGGRGRQWVGRFREHF